jgi:hypothetical protein
MTEKNLFFSITLVHCLILSILSLSIPVITILLQHVTIAVNDDFRGLSRNAYYLFTSTNANSEHAKGRMLCADWELNIQANESRKSANKLNGSNSKQ